MSPTFVDHPQPEILSKGERTRAAIIEAAHGLFVERGYHATSMRQVAQRAGIALGGIYNHFESKEAIFAAVFEHYHPFRQMLPALAAAQGDTIEEFVGDAVRRMVPILAGARQQLIPLIFVEMVEFQGRHLAQLAETAFPELLHFAERLAEHRGALRPVPLPVIVRSFVGFFLAFVFTDMVVPKLPQLQNLEIDWFEQMLDIYLHGIVAAPEPAA
jgi:AcrR family transcriptional regulator